MNKCKLMAVLILGMWFYALPAFSGELGYQPVNPNFGGNPFNAAPLLNSAQAQNDFENPRAAAQRRTGNSLQERIDRLALSILARGALVNITDDMGNLIPGTINTGLTKVEVIDDGITLTMIVTDIATGETTTFTSPSPSVSSP